MKLEKFVPSAALKPFIKEFLIIESELEVHSTSLPDTSMVMSFRFRGSVQRPDGEGRTTIPPAVVSGLRKSARIFYYSGHTANLLVVFKEGGITAFSRIPAHELFNLSIPSDNLFHTTELAEITERLAEADTNRERIDITEAFLLHKLNGHRPDAMIDTAVRLITQQQGIVKIKDLASSLYISQDPFEKKFRARVGTTPKQFASIVRLRNLIKKYPSYSSLTEASYKAGYFDQSHFIKDFRLFTGNAPKDFFKSQQYW